MWTRQSARLEDQPSEQADGDCRCGRGPDAARRGVRAKCSGEQQRLESLQPGGACPRPEYVGDEVEQPRRVLLRVVAIGETEKIRANEMARGNLATLREMPPQIRLVGATETDQPRCPGQDDVPLEIQLPAHIVVVSRR